MFAKLLATATTAVLWRVVIGLLLALVAVAGVQQLRVMDAQLAAAEVQRELSELQGAVAAERAKAEREAREAEQRQRDALDAIERMYKTEMSHAQDVQAAVVADLHNDNLRLREHWRGCETSRLSATAANSARTDDAADLRAAGAGDLVRLGAECDATIRALQRVVIEDRNHAQQD